MFESETSRVTAAAERAQTGLEALLRDDGQPRYSPPEHEERTRAILTTLDETIAEQVAKVEAQVQKLQNELDVLAVDDPLQRLSSSELTSASARGSFVREDMLELPIADLLPRLRAVLAGDDKVAKVLHARYGAARLRAEQPRGQENFDGELRGANVATSETGELVGLIRQLQEQIADPGRVERQAATLAAIEESKMFRFGHVLSVRGAFPRLAPDPAVVERDRAFARAF